MRKCYKNVAAALAGLTATLLLTTAAAEAEESFFRVYQVETPAAGEMESTLWTTTFPRSDGAEDEGETREELWAHSAELEVGLTDRLSLSAYADFEDPSPGSARFTGGRIEARYRLGESDERFFETALYAEYAFPRSLESGTQELETRLILQKEWTGFLLAVNPVLEIPVRGEEAGRRPEVALDAGVYYSRYLKVQPGLEWYSSFGQIGRWDDRRHWIFPTLDLHPAHGWTWHLGVGFTHDGDERAVKSILSYEAD
jgi:hypothetical protein